MSKCNSMLLYVLSIVSIVLSAGLLYQYCATKIDEYRYPAPGTLTDVGGYKLHSYCLGKGKPTVILDAGLGGYSAWWTLVQKEVSEFTHVCSYDRAGYGWSDAGPGPRTSAVIVKELHTLLHRQNIQPPYILVGHSFGGINMKLYANTYPDEVCALVLVDSCYEKQWERFVAHDTKKPLKTMWDSIRDSAMDMCHSRIAHYVGLSRLLIAQDLQPYFAGSLSKDLQKSIIAQSSTVKSLEARDSESYYCSESFNQSANAPHRITNKPLIVISRGKKEDESIDTIWAACQQDLMSNSTRSQHIIAHKSGHMINVEQPEIIVNAIRDLVQQYFAEHEI